MEHIPFHVANPATAALESLSLDSRPRPRIRQSVTTGDLQSMGAQQAHNQELLDRLGEAGLARITQGLGSKRSSQTIAAPGRTPLVRSFEDAASLFEPPLKAFECKTCSICLEPASTTTRKLSCGHLFHSHCLSSYSCSQPSSRSMPCPDCRQPFHAYQDKDAQGHAQARSMLADSQTAMHMGIRHVRPQEGNVTPQCEQPPKEGSIKRERETQNEAPLSKRAIVTVAAIQEEVQKISCDLAQLHHTSQQNFHQQAVNLLQNASVGEILHSLPPPETHAQMSQKELKRRRKLKVSARAKRRRERLQLAKFEKAMREIQEQQKELQQRYFGLCETNQKLTTQLVTSLLNEALPK